MTSRSRSTEGPNVSEATVSDRDSDSELDEMRMQETLAPGADTDLGAMRMQETLAPGASTIDDSARSTPPRPPVTNPATSPATAPEPLAPEAPTESDAERGPVDTPAPGATIGKYQLVRELGRGGMGTVFLARDTLLGRRVAIKFLNVRNPAQATRFIVEAQTTAQCNHENIVVLYEANEHGGSPYMVLEFLEGETLDELLREARSSSRSGEDELLLSVQRAVELVIPVARALERAHSMGIVHRDLKPANVMLTRSGTIKVLDFGISKVLSDDVGSSTALPERAQVMTDLAATQGLSGTLPYMSPEQLDNSDVDGRTDIWAIGIMLYEMVTGQHPLAPISIRKLEQVRKLSIPMPRLSDARPELSKFAAVVDRCLMKDRDRRIGSATELLDELEALLATQASAGGPLAPALSSLPGYTVSGLVGRTRHTHIYRAVRDHDRQPVICKVLSSKPPSPQQLAGLRLEYQILVDLDDVDGVPAALDLVEHERNLILVMSDMGISLDNVLRARPPGIAEVLDLSVQLAGILARIHSRDIYHRDIKPSNIVLHPDNNRAAIIDFGLASRQRRDQQDAAGATTLVGSLPYISPEQTGRMNRAVDYRTDIYSLGITFYQLLTGVLPFQDDDPLTMVHHHLATQPVRLREHNPIIPGQLEAAVLKMIAKNPADRYQSAAGLEADLRRISEQLTTGTLSDFTLGQDDIPQRFELPQKLYGRDREKQLLLDSFDKAAAGYVQLAMVAGYSGVGKTRLIHELHQPIVARRGDFIFTKFDQYQRSVSYVALGQALGRLIRQILTESKEQVERWRQRILEALNSMGALLIDAVPELELLIGAQPSVVPLSGSDAQTRFVSLLARFIGVLATADHPLVFFLDDLQWADQATLDFLAFLLDSSNRLHLLLIGAYRDNEVSASHPLMLALDELRKIRDIDTITLQPLDLDDTNEFVADALHCDRDSTLVLSQLILSRTDGNPFFLGQFLTSLYEKRKLTFDHEARAWAWDLERIRSVEASLNVVELMVAKVRELPAATQEVLEIAACLGNRFDLRTLAHAGGESARLMARRVDPAVAEEFVIALSHTYRYYEIGSDDELPPVPPEEIHFKFVHDRVHEAVYSRIPDDERIASHLRIGRILLTILSPEAREERLFDIVNHLNQGIQSITEQGEREQLAQLNLAAGEKAMSAAAYPGARDYFTVGLELLADSPDPWTSHYPVMLRLSRNLCECEYLCVNMDRAQAIFRETLPRARDDFDKADLYELIMGACLTYGQFVEATLLGQECMRIFNLTLPEEADEVRAALAREHALIRDLLAGRDIPSLLDRGRTEDSRLLISMAILHRMWTSAYMVSDLADLGTLAALKIVSLSLAHGHADFSAFGYIIYGSLLSDDGDYQRAYEFGQLALGLNDRFGNILLVPKVNNMFAHTISHYRRHLGENIPFYTESYKASVQCGDVWWGVWAVNFLVVCRFIKGDRLSEVYEDSCNYIDYVKSSGDRALLQMLYFDQHVMLNLMGLTLDRDTLDSDIFNERKMVAYLQGIPFEFMLFWYHLYRSFLAYLYGDGAAALHHSRLADEKKRFAPGFMLVTDHVFLHGLILLDNLADTPDAMHSQVLDQIDADIAQVQIWAKHSPDNYRHRRLLMTAERCRAAGEVTLAMEYYDRAIAEAERTGYLNHLALANELAARFYLGLERNKIAWIYMYDAVRGYQAWGAEAKAENLDQRFGELLASHPLYEQLDNLAAPQTIQSVSDLDALLKASRVLSEETDTDVALGKLLEVCMRHVGALRACLIVPDGDHLLVQNEGWLHGRELDIKSVKSVADRDRGDLPWEIIRYVFRSGEELILGNASEQGMFTRDPYVQERRSKSILCVPFVSHGTLRAIAYLENDQLTGAFSDEHLDILRLLANQASSSLANAGRVFTESVP